MASTTCRCTFNMRFIGSSISPKANLEPSVYVHALPSSPVLQHRSISLSSKLCMSPKKSQKSAENASVSQSSVDLELHSNWSRYSNILKSISTIKPFRKVAKKQQEDSATPENLSEESKVNGFKATLNSMTSSAIVRKSRMQHNLDEAIESTNTCVREHLKDAKHPTSKLDINVSLENLKPESEMVANEEIRPESTDLEITPTTSETPLPEKELSKFSFAILRHYLPSISRKTNQVKKAVTKPNITKLALNSRARNAVLSLRTCTSISSKLIRLEEFSNFFQRYPAASSIAIQEQAIPLLLRFRKSSDVTLQEKVNEALALIGHIDPPSGRGIRILSLDGGGTKGLMLIQMLRLLEEMTGQKTADQFDFICGVSTGALIALMVGIYRVPLDECEHMYKDFSKQMFDRSRLRGTSNLLTTHAYYDALQWEEILRKNLGQKSFLDTRNDPNCPLIATISTIVNQARMENFLFRNYRYPQNVHSFYPGSMLHTLWEAVRASTAAPGYFQEFQLDEHIHQDGGLLTNNPTAIAIHECRLLWPNSPIQAVISLGTGRSHPQHSSTFGLKDKILKIVESATETESVHTVMHDLLPPAVYFRFNPYLSEEIGLDEVNETKIVQLLHDTDMYCRRNEYKFKMAAHQIMLTKNPHHKLYDWIKLKKLMYNV